MPKTYVVQRGESLSSIAAAALKDAKLAKALSDYNALRTTRLTPGQQLQIPDARELRPTSRALTRDIRWPAPPVGLQGVTATFGDPFRFLKADGTVDPKWETTFMARAKLPFAIPLDWDATKSATSIRCHKLLVPLFEEVFAQIVSRGLKSRVKTYGGCYVFRLKRGGAKPSTHSWGIAIDLNCQSNGMGSAGDMDPELVTLFESYGFVWGGRWSGRSKDPMHFQYCSAY